MAPVARPAIGSGVRTSTTTAEVAVYFLGSIRLTPTTVPTVRTNTTTTVSQRERRMVISWASDMAGCSPGVRAAPQNRLSRT